MVSISNQIPDIYHICKEKWGVDWDKGVIFTWGETIHCKFPLSPSLIAHEMTHVEQQANGVVLWWSKYLDDPAFRLSQELEAYRNQVNFIKQQVKDRNKKAVMIHEICQHLSGPMYGNIISFEEAKKKLQ